MHTAIRSTPASDSRLVRILDAYLAALHAGTPPATDELLAQYPELAGDLETCLASLEFIRRGAISASLHEAEGENPLGTCPVSRVAVARDSVGPLNSSPTITSSRPATCSSAAATRAGSLSPVPSVSSSNAAASGGRPEASPSASAALSARP